MIVVVIIGILTAVALPSYREHVKKGKRAEAQVQMMDIATRQQQYLLSNRSYLAHTDANWTSIYSLPSTVAASYSYTIAVNNSATPPTYTITFSPLSTGPMAGDGDLTLNQAGVKSPASKW